MGRGNVFSNSFKVIIKQMVTPSLDKEHTDGRVNTIQMETGLMCPGLPGKEVRVQR